MNQYIYTIINNGRIYPTEKITSRKKAREVYSMLKSIGNNPEIYREPIERGAAKRIR